MTYAIIACVNGAFSVKAEGLTLESAKVFYHGLCQTLWNAPDVIKAFVIIADEEMNVADGYKEYIHHTVG